MNQKLSDTFLFKCKELDLAGVIPAVSMEAHDSNFKFMIDLSEKIIQSESVDYFSDFLQEGHYLIQLWAAHILLTFEISDSLRDESISIIKQYTNNPLAPEVAEAETIWFNKHYPNYNAQN